VSADGQHFVSVLGGPSRQMREINLMLNWFSRGPGETP